MSDQVETPVTEDVEGAFEDHINDLVTRLEDTAKNVKNIVSELKILKKDHGKIVKKITGTRRKKAVKDPNAPKKAPSGFAKPTKISAELASFLGVSEGEMIARPDVTKGITKYVKEHNLQKEENKRIIDLSKPGGDALIELLNIPEGQELTFFNLQKYLKIHFPVSEKEPKAPKAPKEKAEKPAAKPRASKKALKEVVEEELIEEEQVTAPKKRATKTKATTPVEEEPVAAPKKRATKAKAESVEEEAPAPKSRVSKVKAKAATVAEPEEEVGEEAPVEEVKPRSRRRKAEEA